MSLKLTHSLPIILLLANLVSTEHRRPPLFRSHSRHPPRLSPRVEGTSNRPAKIRLGADAYKGFDKFFLMSIDRPTIVKFRTTHALVERLTTSGFTNVTDNNDTASCSFPVFDEDEYATYNIASRSLASSDTEIFALTKIFHEDPRKSGMQIFVVNMTDCRYHKIKILRGYDFESTKTLIVLRNNNLEIFSLNDTNKCGTFICKRVYDIANMSISEPMKFFFPNDHLDSFLAFIGPSADGGYISVVRKDNTISLLSLTSTGSLIRSSENIAEATLDFYRTFSTYHGAFGFCLREKQSEVHCKQLDKDLNINIDEIKEFDDKTKFLAVHNMPSQGGLLLLTISCPKEIVDQRSWSSCEKHEMKITRFDTNGFNREFASFKDEDCVPLTHLKFVFFEENGKICVSYGANCRKRVGEGHEKLLRYRCFSMEVERND